MKEWSDKVEDGFVGRLITTLGQLLRFAKFILIEKTLECLKIMSFLRRIS